MNKIILLIFATVPILFSSVYYEYGKKVELTPHTQNKSQQFKIQDKNTTIRYYKNNNNRVIGVKNTIIAKCLKQRDCETVIKRYQNLSYKIISKDTYLITVGTQEDIFIISVKLYEEGCFLYAHPNFYRTRELR